MSDDSTDRRTDVADMVREAGLDGLEPEVREDLLRVLRADLEARVGATLSDLMTEAQLGEFERYAERDDDERAHEVLRRAVPYFSAIVHGQAAALRAELIALAPRIRATGATTEAP